MEGYDLDEGYGTLGPPVQDSDGVGCPTTMDGPKSAVWRVGTLGLWPDPEHPLHTGTSGDLSGLLGPCPDRVAGGDPGLVPTAAARRGYHLYSTYTSVDLY